MPDEPFQARSLFHININVSNFERSIAFYERLGFRMLRNHDGMRWPDSTGDAVGLPGGQGRACLMMLGEDERASTRLDLIEWTQPVSEPREAHPANELGVPRIAIWMRNVADAYERLKAEGVRFITEPTGGSPEGGVRNMVSCRDPDGLIIELIEFERGA